MTAKLAPKYTNTSSHVKFTIDKEVYEDLYEDFQDEIFDTESKIKRDEWIEAVKDR